MNPSELIDQLTENLEHVEEALVRWNPGVNASSLMSEDSHILMFCKPEGKAWGLWIRVNQKMDPKPEFKCFNDCSAKIRVKVAEALDPLLTDLFDNVRNKVSDYQKAITASDLALSRIQAFMEEKCPNTSSVSIDPKQS